MRVFAVLALCLASAPLLASPTPQAESAPSSSAPPSTTPPSDAAETPPPSAPEAPPERLSVVVLDLQATNSTPETARLVTDLVAVSLQRTGRLAVLTSEDVRSVMAFEAEKQSAGCDDASCLAELAGALGAALVVHGSVGQLGELFVVNLNLFDSREARSAGRESAQVRDRAELPVAIDRMTRALVGGTIELPPPSPDDAASEPAAPSPWLSPLFLGGATVGTLAAGGAVVLGAWALTIDNTLATSRGLDGASRADEKERGVGVVVGASVLALAAAGAAVVAAVPFFE